MTPAKIATLCAAIALALAWPARGDAPPGRYTYPMDGIVNDTKTKLSWQRAPDAMQRIQFDAQSYCSSLTLASGGWRLPTRAELLSLADRSRRAPAIDPTAFPDTPTGGFWTSTPGVDTFGSFWAASFDEGTAYPNASTNQFYVRCVRATR